MKKVIDQLNREITIKSANRIVSLVPSQTELLVDLGLEEKIVGITKFCIHPSNLKREKTLVGGTKNFDINKILGLNPDLIIGNKEENTKDKIEELAEKCPVWLSDILTIDDAKQMITSIGSITKTEEKASEITNQINQLIQKINQLKKEKQSVAYLIWKNPLMAAGEDTFINAILKLLGYKNVFTNPTHGRYPLTDIKEIKKLNPNLLILSSEPYPFKEKDIEEFKIELPKTSIKIMDGEIFSWYGSRLIPSLEKILELLSSNC